MEKFPISKIPNGRITESNISRLKKKLTFSSSITFNSDNNLNINSIHNSNSENQLSTVLCPICNIRIKKSDYLDHELCHQLDRHSIFNEENSHINQNNQNHISLPIRRIRNLVIETGILQRRSNDLSSSLSSDNDSSIFISRRRGKHLL